jgi:hypothetical protein
MFNNQRLNVEPSTYHCMDHHAIPNGLLGYSSQSPAWFTTIIHHLWLIISQMQNPQLVTYSPTWSYICQLKFDEPPSGQILIVSNSEVLASGDVHLTEDYGLWLANELEKIDPQIPGPLQPPRQIAPASSLVRRGPGRYRLGPSEWWNLSKNLTWLGPSR